MGTRRLEAFSDGVFAIAITLLVLEIKVPDDGADLGRELLHLWPSYLAYVISFLLIGLVWANHHQMLDEIARADRLLLFLNTLLLMNVAFLPFVTAVVATALKDGSTDAERVAVLVYGGSLVIGGVFFNGIWWWAVRGGLVDGPADGEVPTHARRMGTWFVAGPFLYLVGMLVGWAVPLAGLAVYAAMIVFYWLPVPKSAASG